MDRVRDKEMCVFLNIALPVNLLNLTVRWFTRSHSGFELNILGWYGVLLIILKYQMHVCEAKHYPPIFLSFNSSV